MKQFIDDIITRISDYFKSDSDIAKAVKVDYANKQGDTINPPHITVQQMDDSNAEEYDTFEGECISYVPIQLTIYAQQMKIGGVVKSAQESAFIIADKVIKLFDKVETVKWNSNIVRLRRVGGVFAMPTEQGATTYMSPVRYEFYVLRNYQKIS